MLAKNKNRSDYALSLVRARRVRMVNAVLCAVGLLAAAAAAVPAWGTEYRFAVLGLAVAAAVGLGALLAKNIREAKTVARVRDTGTYAVKLTGAWQERVRTFLLKRGRQFHMTVFLVLSTVEAVVLTVLFLMTGSSMYLLYLAVFSLVCLFIAFVAGLYLGVRLADRRAYITVSPRGAVVCGEVIPFDAENGDVQTVYAFDDAYLVRLCREGIFGLSYNGELLLPAGGAVRKGLEMSADEAVCAALGVRELCEVEGDFYESRTYGDAPEDRPGARVGEVTETAEEQKNAPEQEANAPTETAAKVPVAETATELA